MERAQRRRAVAIVLALALLTLVCELRYRFFSVVPETATPLAFSGARAAAARARVLKDVAAHPPGTEGAVQVRERVIGELTAIGLRPEVRVATTCGRYGACAVVHNVVARLAGAANTGAVLLIAHHDSVPAGPGASDDGAGVATVLEIARALVAAGPQRNDVVVLLDDGEELGLLGAEAFVRSDPLAADVRAVVNVEARGTEGPATLFQTSRDAGFLVEIFAREAPRPVGSSLFATVYERMPNDTDLTVFLERGLHGVNFAFSSGVERYHTPHDDLAHGSTRSLQHQGESALAMVRGLAATDLRAPPPGDAVWFDLLGLTVVRWPTRATIPIALVSAAGILFAAITSLRARRVRGGELVVATVAMLLLPVASLVIGAVPFFVARAAGALPAPWIAHPQPLWIACACGPVVALLSVAAVARRRVSAEAVWLAGSLASSVFAVLLAWLLPGASYLLVAPLFVAGMAATASSFAQARDVTRDFAVLAAGAAMLATCALVLRTLYPGLGFAVGPAPSLLLGFVVLPLAPLAWALPAPGRALGWASGLVGLATALATVVPRFSAEVPRRVNVVHRQDERGVRWAVDASWAGNAWGTVPEPMRASLGVSAHEGLAFPWSRAPSWIADGPLPAAPLPPPEAIELSRSSPAAGEANARQVRLRLRSVRGARGLRLIVPPAAGALRLELAGALVAPIPVRWDLAAGFRAFVIEGVPAVGVEVTVSLVGPAAEIYFADVSSGVPDHPVLASRPADAVASQEGDLTLVVRTLRL